MALENATGMPIAFWPGAVPNGSTCMASPRLPLAASAHELAQQLAQLWGLLQRRTQSFESIFSVDHHRAAPKATLVVVVAEANAVGAGVVGVLEQLNRRLRVLSGVGGLLDDLAVTPVELELARHVAPGAAPRRGTRHG